MITIQLNGEPYPLKDGARVSTLLETLELRPTRVAVELNLQVVPKSQYASAELKDGDKVEVINFVGGG